MRQRVVSVDHFYDDPYSIRKAALSLEYKDGLSTTSLTNREAIDKFSYLANAQVQPVDFLPSGHIKQTYITDKLDSIDARPLIDLIGVVYLTLPSQSEGERSVGLFIHNKTGLENIPTDTNMVMQGWSSLEEIHEGFVAVDGHRPECWTAWYTGFQRYNRAILFDAKLWHQHLQGHGDSINNCRLSQLFYLKVT